MDIDTTGYDFIDFGYGKGGAYGLALKKFKAKKGVSLDLREESKRLATKLGHNCILGDVLTCSFKPKSVGFVTIVHFLEHLNDMKDVRKAIALAAGAAKSFLYIEGPAFECDKLLRRYGLKFNWADWLGHPSPVTANDLVEMFREQKCHSYMLFYLDQVYSSDDAAIHPTTSPGNQREYKRNRHPPKRKIIFNEPIYKYFVIYGFLRAPSFELKQKLKSVRARAVLFEEGVF
jgi:hypothetical protein